MIDLTKIEYRYYNNRDIEIPMLMTFLNDFDYGIYSLLDVGAHDSHASYARKVAEFMKERPAYHAIDILPDPITAQIVDGWFTGNFLEFEHEDYDCVISISAIEHAGITTYKAIPMGERLKIVEKMFTLSKRFVFLTFPFGQPGGSDQYQNIGPEEFRLYDVAAEGHGFVPLFQEFFFNPFPQEKREWMSVTRAECAAVPYDSRIDQQTVACLAWMKK
jgi:hypothetical protein